MERKLIRKGKIDWETITLTEMNLAELKCLYNLLLDTLDEYPEMITYRKISEEFKLKIEEYERDAK